MPNIQSKVVNVICVMAAAAGGNKKKHDKIKCKCVCVYALYYIISSFECAQ